MKKTTTKKLLLTTTKVRDLRPLTNAELDGVVGGHRPSSASSHAGSGGSVTQDPTSD